MNKGKVAKIIVNTLIWLVLAASILVVIGTLNTNEDGISNIGGVGYLSVQSDSMEDEFKKGDLIFVRTTSVDDTFDVYDIVTFYTIINGQPALNTHEIIAVEEVQGVINYTTQGLNESEADPGTRVSGDIVAIYTGNKISGFGNVIDFLQTSVGFLVAVVLPLAALFLYQIIYSSMLIAGYRASSSGKGDLDKLSDEEKAKIAEQYLKSKKEEEAKAKKEDDKK